MQTCVEKWGGPSSERLSIGGRQSSGRGGAFFAANKKKITNPKYSFPQTPVQFMAQGAQSSTPWRRLLSKKAIVLEPRSQADLNDAIAEFKKFIGMPKSNGCILMGVCRGKISEGIDFSDDMCRAVIVTGLPFAPFYDPKVKLKRDFLDAARLSERAKPSGVGGFGDKEASNNHVSASATTLSGTEWYNQAAHRAVNQAIGRVIRHRHDYGAVILLDHRFAEQRNRDGLSKWVVSYSYFRCCFSFCNTTLSHLPSSCTASVLIYETKHSAQLHEDLFSSSRSRKQRQRKLKPFYRHSLWKFATTQ